MSVLSWLSKCDANALVVPSLMSASSALIVMQGDSTGSGSGMREVVGKITVGGWLINIAKIR